MPYRAAHWWVLALAPIIAVAFWPNYWSQLGTAPFALHAHGITASLWVLLVAAQSWTIQARHNFFHRQLGLAIFILVPAFAAGGALAMQSMAALFVNQVTPFHTLFGARLGVADGIAGPTLVGLVAYALIVRRRVRPHAAAMLATIVLVLPPVLGRLVRFVPGISELVEATGLHPFVFGYHGGQLISVMLALWLALRDAGAKGPFLAVAASGLAQIIGFETIGRTAAWEALMAWLTTVPAIVIASSAATLAALILWWAWKRVPQRVVPVGRSPATA